MNRYVIAYSKTTFEYISNIFKYVGSYPNIVQITEDSIWLDLDKKTYLISMDSGSILPNTYKISDISEVKSMMRDKNITEILNE